MESIHEITEWNRQNTEWNHENTAWNRQNMEWNHKNTESICKIMDSDRDPGQRIRGARR